MVMYIFTLHNPHTIYSVVSDVFEKMEYIDILASWETIMLWHFGNSRSRRKLNNGIFFGEQSPS